MSVTADPQTSLEETEIFNDELAGALERREERKAERSEAQKAFKEADDAVKRIAELLEIDEGSTVRCGKWRISRRAVAARSVSFETNPTSRLTISLLPDEGA